MCPGRLGNLNLGITNAPPLFGTFEKHLVRQVPGIGFGRDVARNALALGLPLSLLFPLLLQDLALSLGL